MSRATNELGTMTAEYALETSINRRKAAIKKDLIEFSKFVDPKAAEWYGARHLRVIADKLMGAARTPNSRLIINLPPRHWKSSLASEKFPAWYLGHYPERAVILASYGVTLAEKFSRSVRDMIVGNDRYKLLFPKTIVRPDISRVDDWMLVGGTRSSFRAAGVGGGINGLGGDLLILDDPVMDYEQSQSMSWRKVLRDWFRGVFRQRVNPGTSIVIIMSPWNEDDIVGWLLWLEKNEGGEHYDVIDMPAVDEAGNYLWPERIPPEEYERMRVSIGDFAWRNQWLCKRGADVGAEIQRSWFQFFPELPAEASWRVRAWDLAITKKTVEKPNPDFTATVKATMHEGCLWLGSPRLMRENWTVVQNEIKVAYANERTLRTGTGQSNVETATVQALLREGIKIEPVDERHGDHRARASVWINWAKLGRIKLVGTPEEWDAFLSQFCSFPLGHDDAIDVVSDVARMLNLSLVSPLGHTQSREYDKRVDVLRELGRLM